MEQNSINDISELAKVLGLSISTVSRVLNGKSESYRISVKTKQRVLEAAAKYNYKPNLLARSLKLKKTNTIGLIVPDISNSFFSDIARSIENEARNHDYSLILCDSKDDVSIENHLISLLQSHKVEGIIIAPVGLEYEHIVNYFKSGNAIVTIDRYFPNVDLPSVCSDNYQGAYDATDYLISMGHRNIVCLKGLSTSVTAERIKGYVSALKMNNIPLDENYILGDDFTIENGYYHTIKLLKNIQKPTAIFSLSNLIALGVLKAIIELGLKIPEDISMLTFDDHLYSPYLRTPMTTVRQEQIEMGRLALDYLIKQIEDNDYSRKNPISMRLNTRLIIRDSVKRLQE